jgi:glycosyltransferase involved in cell wall biosynthesis
LTAAAGTPASDDRAGDDVASSTCRRRILIFTDGFPPHDRGGAERIAYYHAHALRDRGDAVAVFTSHPSDGRSRPAVADEDGVCVYRAFPLNPVARRSDSTRVDRLVTMGSSLVNPFMSGALRRVVDDFRPDLLHAHYVVRISHAAFARVAPGLPRVLTFHGYQYECPKGGLYRKRRDEICRDKPLPCRIFRNALTRELSPVDRIVAISHFIRDRLVEAGHPAEKVRYIPNGVPDLERRSAGPASENRGFLFVGRLVRAKGAVELIEAFRRIDDPTTRLTIVGDGDDRPRAEAAARGDDRIRFTGWQSVDEVAEHYRAARAVVVPSLWHEVMNTVICEAQSWTRPVISSRVGGNLDLIADGRSGYLCEPGDAEELSRRMEEILADDGLTDRLGREGFAHVGQYGMQRHIDSIVALYDELLSDEGAARRQREANTAS